MAAPEPGAPLGTRAVLKEIVSGTDVACAGCGGRITFAPRKRSSQVVCNVYAGGRWARIEHFHEQCYAEAGEPHGAPDTSQVRRLGALRARAGHGRGAHHAHRTA